MRLRGRLVDHVSLVDAVWSFLGQNRDSDLDVYLRVAFARVCDRVTGFRSAITNVVEKHSVVLRQDVLSIFTHLYSSLAASSSDPSVTASWNPLGLGAAPHPSWCVV